jgi:succinate dehydrogenase/fumarate reductase flavoprotein subunit
VVTIQQMPLEHQRTDVLVIGGGGAALRAALAARESDPALRVTLVTKGALGASGVTATACSDRMAFHATLPHTQPGGTDAWRYHASDIYAIGGQVSDADLAEILARGAEEAFAYLDELGVPWVRRADGLADQFLTDGSVYPRACYTGPYTANHISAALVTAIRSTPVTVLEHCMALELVQQPDGTVAGALLANERDQRLVLLQAGAVVLATGGAGQVFATNVFPRDCTGDGYAMAYRAGAALVNLEFIQLGLCSTRTGLACSGSMMRALPRLVNDAGIEFLADYMPEHTAAERYAILFAKGASWPVSQRDPSHQIDIAVAGEIAAGRRVYLDYGSDPVDLDLEALPPAILARLQQEKGSLLTASERNSPLARLQAINPPSVQWLAQRGIALTEGEPIEIAPSVQHFQGGIKIRTEGETTVPGLYAAGEAAGGQHGANRPGGNALLDGQVFGRIAGRSAAQFAGTARKSAEGAGVQAAPALDSLSDLFRDDGLPPQEVIARVQGCMSQRCGVHRTTSGLQSAIAELEQLASSGVNSRQAHITSAVEAVNILTVARAIALAALKREESRGPHLRFATAQSLEPIPIDDEHWRRYILVHQRPKGPDTEVRDPVRPA